MRPPSTHRRSTAGHRWSAVLVIAVAMSLSAGPATAATAPVGNAPVVTAPAASPTATAPAAPAATSGDRSSCLAGAQQYRCVLPMPSDPLVPYTMTVPAGMTRATVQMSGGNGANGDDNADGGQAGLLVAELSLVPGHQLEVWVASGADSIHAGTGWRTGGDGAGPNGLHLGSRSGGGGGASAIVDQTTDRVLAVAGGGGGAGGSYNDVSFGGQGGSSGRPAGAGTAGGTSAAIPSGRGNNQGDPGDGGCAGGPPVDTSCSTVHPGDARGNGGDGVGDVLTHEVGGGGGGGIHGGAGGDGDGNPVFPAGGGGGGGGESFVDAHAGAAVAFGSTDTYQGSVAFSPPGTSTKLQCTADDGTIDNTVHYTVPTGVFEVYAVLGGGQGGVSDSKPARAGFGAFAAGNIRVSPGEDLFLEAGCRGYGQNPSDGLGNSGGGGAGHDSGPQGGDDGGGGGGGSALVETSTGAALIQAGGGGGGGGTGYGMSGGAGGNAGLDWGQPGAGNGSPACGPASASACTDPEAGGSGGDAGYHPGTGDGDQGSSFNTLNATGGGGGGGGGWVGGQGGAAGGNTTQGGGGGGAGSSTYDATIVDTTSIGTSTTPGDGFVVVLAIYASNSGLNNNGIVSAAPAGAGAGQGFDDNGQWYSAQALSDNGITAGRSTPPAADGVSVIWPDVTVGQPDNYLAHGQSIPVTGTGTVLQVLGAGTYVPYGGTVGGQATINFADGSTQQFELRLADWSAGSPAAGTFAAFSQWYTGITTQDRAQNPQASIWGQEVTIPATKAVTSLTLPWADQFSSTGPTLHVFAAGVGTGIAGARPAPARTPAPPARKPSPGSPAATIVAPGDTLSAIAARHHVVGGAPALLAQNRSVLGDADSIVAGQRLQVAGTAAPGTVDVVEISTGSGSSKKHLDRVEASHLNSLVLQVYRDAGGSIVTRTWSDGRPGMTMINESGVAVDVTATRGRITRFTAEIAAGSTRVATIPR